MYWIHVAEDMAHIAVFVTKAEVSWTDEVLIFLDRPRTLQ
jgi:hypothetical protein